MKWNFSEIIGEVPIPARSIPTVPILGEREILWSSGKRTTGLQAQLDRAGREEAIKAIFGECGHEMLENPALVEPSTSTYAQPRMPSPTPEADTRKIECDCPCPFCERQDHRNCDAEQRCEIGGYGAISEILDVSEEIKHEFANAALTHQRERQRKARIAKHRPHLVGLMDKFKAQTRSSGVNGKLFERVADSMAAYMADYVV